jgi:hypothetical protein
MDFREIGCNSMDWTEMAKWLASEHMYIYQLLKMAYDHRDMMEDMSYHYLYSCAPESG